MSDENNVKDDYSTSPRSLPKTTMLKQPKCDKAASYTQTIMLPTITTPEERRRKEDARFAVGIRRRIT